MRPKRPSSSTGAVRIFSSSRGAPSLPVACAASTSNPLPVCDPRRFSAAARRSCYFAQKSSPDDRFVRAIARATMSFYGASLRPEADPLFAVLGDLLLPDRHRLLEPIDRRAAGLERRRAMRRRRRDDHGRPHRRRACRRDARWRRARPAARRRARAPISASLRSAIGRYASYSSRTMRLPRLCRRTTPVNVTTPPCSSHAHRAHHLVERQRLVAHAKQRAASVAPPRRRPAESARSRPRRRARDRPRANSSLTAILIAGRSPPSSGCSRSSSRHAAADVRARRQLERLLVAPEPLAHDGKIEHPHSHAGLTKGKTASLSDDAAVRRTSSCGSQADALQSVRGCVLNERPKRNDRTYCCSRS